MKNKAPLYVDKTTGGDILQKKSDYYEKEAFLVLPIISDNRVIGVLNMTEKIGADIFEQDEHQMLLSIAGQLIGALENQRLTESFN